MNVKPIETGLETTRYVIERRRTGCAAQTAGRQRRRSCDGAAEPVQYTTYARDEKRETNMEQ